VAAVVHRLRGHRHRSGEAGHRYAFRLSATDSTGNSDGAQAQTGAVRVTKYYYHGSSRVAQRRGGVLYYLHTDHLGSTSLATHGTSGAKVSRVLYYPYGETRYTEGTLPTDRLYTGQRWEQGFGLYDYHARYYDPALGRFISADTVVPQPENH